MLVVALSIIISNLLVSLVTGYAQWSLSFQGQCQQSTSNANITNCNSIGYTEQMNAYLDHEHGVDYRVLYNEIGWALVWYNQLNFSQGGQAPNIHAEFELRDEYGATAGRIYAHGLHSDFRIDSNNYWVQTAIYTIHNSTGAFESYTENGFVAESTLGDHEGYFDSVVTVSVYGASNNKDTKFKRSYSK